jgi:hypothetical protein
MDLKDGWIKKLIFNGLEASCFHNHFALTIKGIGLWEQRITIVIKKREPANRISNVKNFNK